MRGLARPGAAQTVPLSSRLTCEGLLPRRLPRCFGWPVASLSDGFPNPQRSHALISSSAAIVSLHVGMEAVPPHFDSRIPLRFVWVWYVSGWKRGSLLTGSKDIAVRTFAILPHEHVRQQGHRTLFLRPTTRESLRCQLKAHFRYRTEPATRCIRLSNCI